MKHSHRLMRLLVAGITSAALMAPAAVSAAPPLPLPSVVLYGVASGAGGVLASGSVKLTLPRGGIVTAAIGAVSGTGYNYTVALPLGMPGTGTSLTDPGTAAVGEAIRFYLNDTLAVVRDQGGIARGQFEIPANAMGKAYRLDLSLVGPEAYPLGDVNASGARDSADSLLVLRYDVGLTTGGNSFPPPPRTIYLPLCDIVQDGRCNSSDALRILQCDVGTPGVTCPAAGMGVSIASAPLTPTLTAELVLRTDFASGPQPGMVTVSVLAEDPMSRLGAASVDLRYNSAGMLNASCAADPEHGFDAAFCNAGILTDTVRVSVVSMKGAGARPVLAAVSFRLADQSLGASQAALGRYLSQAITLTARAVFDSEGQPLPWRILGPLAQSSRIYLPLITRGWGGGGTLPTPLVTPSAVPTPTVTATVTATAAPSQTPAGTVTPTATPSATATPTGTAQPLPTGTPTASPTAAPTAAATATPSAAPTPTATTAPAPTVTPTSVPAATPTPTAPPTATPAAPPTLTPSPSPPPATGTPTATPLATPTATPTR